MGWRADDKQVDFETVNIGGLDIVCATRTELAKAITASCQAARRRGRQSAPYLVFDTNGHGLSLNATDKKYRAAMAAADIIHADGGFLVTLSRLFGSHAIGERSATTDMFHDLAKTAALHGLSFYLLGGTEETNAECARIMPRLYPGLIIAGRHHGYFSQKEELEIVSKINEASPDVLWVGLGKPREQLFAVTHRNALRASWLVTCGGCYNFVTGNYRRAPLWMRNNNLEWLFRLITAPRRFLWRYLTTNPHALWLALTRSKW